MLKGYLVIFGWTLELVLFAVKCSIGN